MRKIKICFLFVSPHYGGAVTVVSHLVEGLDSNKYDISLIFDSRFSEIDSRLKIAKSFPIRIKGIAFFLDIIKFYYLLKNGNYDIVHSHNTKTHIIGMILAYFAKIPMKICTIHEDILGLLKIKKKNNFIVLSLFKAIFSLADIIVCVSNSTLKKNKALLTNDKTFVVRNGYKINEDIKVVDNFCFKEVHAKYTTISYIGRIVEEKGLHILIEALKLIDPRVNINVHIIGGSYNDDYYKKIIKLISQYELKNIYFHGILKNFDSLLCQTDIVVVPSLMESMGYSILDAWNHKKAVIATNVDGIPEVIADGYDGLLFEINNAVDLAKKIIYLIQRPDIRKKLGENGYIKLREQYSAVNFVKNMEIIYSTRR